MSVPDFDSAHFRRILGHYPTGVCAVTSTQADGSPVGMTIGSFTSVSLEPPLVAFFPDRKSTTWPKIERAGRFCVNVLAASQQDHCRLLAMKADNKFEAIPYRLSNRGLPILDGVVSWIDCDLDSVQEAGDHFIVVGRVTELDVELASGPLLFFQGGYGNFAPL
jgi:3-hydroxy-9,10-secoandrosta-1,3,5(10)-triene-9,17-dione monooxygenase reductase component